MAVKKRVRWLVLLVSALPFLSFLMALAITAPSVCAESTDLIVIKSENASVYLEKDGSADIRYNIDINVRPQSSVVNNLLIHLPNWRFDIGSSTVTLDGIPHHSLKKVGPSESDLKISFEVGEGLQPGSSHLLSIFVNVGAMALKHPSDSNKARVSFTPTWWDPNIVQEIQAMTVSINLPEHFLDQSKIRYSEGATVTEHGNRVVLTWTYGAVAPDTKTTLHADFPASVVDKVYDPFWDIQFHFYQNYLLILLLIIPVVVIAYGIKRAMRKPYVKPYLNIEGWGPRKGFGPMEAALLLDVERERVAAMYLLDLVMVEAIKINDPNTMEIQVLNPDYEGRSAQFLGCIRAGRLDPIPTTNFLGALKDEVQAKLESYDIIETKTYYKKQGTSKGHISKSSKSPTVDTLLWIMTDPKAKKRFEEADYEGVPDWASWKVIL